MLGKIKFSNCTSVPCYFKKTWDDKIWSADVKTKAKPDKYDEIPQYNT